MTKLAEHFGQQGIAMLADPLGGPGLIGPASFSFSLPSKAGPHWSALFRDASYLRANLKSHELKLFYHSSRATFEAQSYWSNRCIGLVAQ
ncbi:hypothetical protein EYF80_050406 [Liparis tanakae]|uniref:Uncharacterized protein n=1 Tax=Liparis tanakae TaxID=230148 RepID=A0A4Z2FE16_9TELE|nr:hypothetical protein EYF80_050406 [Liparis tanakae]